MASVLVIDESQQRAVEICTGLIQAGHQVAAVLPSALELVARIEEIKPEYIEGLTFHYVKEMSEVLKIAITDQKVKNAKIL